jgi:hypothetical protein
MLSFLKNHPFAVVASFDYSLTLTFALPKADLQHLIPDCLSLELYKGEWAFLAVAMVQTKALRPKGLPSFMGNDFFLTGYRIFVRYINSRGKRLRGLYILKSETDSKRMELLGNIFTHYKFAATDININTAAGLTEISSLQSAFKCSYETNALAVSLPEYSPFDNWQDARKFSGPLPFTFTWNKEQQEVLVVEGIRQSWNPVPIKVVAYQFPFLNELGLQNAVLANAFIVNNIPYHWKKGKREKLWNQ